MLSRLTVYTIMFLITLPACHAELGVDSPDADANISPSSSGGTTCSELDTDCETPPTPTPPGTTTPPTPPPDTVEVPLFFIGDCVTASCPATTPYPVGCNVVFSPGDDRGCVASTPTNAVVYFQAGDQCNKGVVGGSLYCSATPGAALDVASCAINKPVPIYASSPGGCPAVH